MGWIKRVSICERDEAIDIIINIYLYTTNYNTTIYIVNQTKVTTNHQIKNQYINIEQNNSI